MQQFTKRRTFARLWLGLLVVMWSSELVLAQTNYQVGGSLPWLEVDPELRTWRLTLPKTWHAKLLAAQPEFVLWKPRDYAPEAVFSILRDPDALTTNVAPSVLVTDWDDDGVQDLILDGHTLSHSVLLVLPYQGDVKMLHRGPLSKSDTHVRWEQEVWLPGRTTHLLSGEKLCRHVGGSKIVEPLLPIRRSVRCDAADSLRGPEGHR